MTQVPESFNRFQVLRTLGKGGMGTVYLARDGRLDRLVAIKVLQLSEFAADDRRARFMREARTAASIRHANVATIYEVGEDSDVPFIVMEYCHGETLAQRIRRRSLEPAEFLQIARQIAAGVEAAHDNGIIHRDLKAANIIIEPSGQAKILDFGLAKPIHTAFSQTNAIDSTVGQMFGTIHYLSPEQARGLPADERSDLFALGVVFFQMATGQLPFNSDAPLMVLEKIRDTEPEPFVPLDSNFPPAAAKMIGTLLKKNPDDRYQTARELHADLDELQTPTARHTLSPSMHSRSVIGRTMRRPHWLRIAAIAIAAMIVATASYYAGHSAKPDVSPTATPQPIHSMAVLPLENISNNIKDDFLSVGLADALVTKLQQIPSLQVRPTSAVMEFRNKKLDVKSANDTLKVDGVLEGHFLAAGNLVRVTLQLTDTRTGYSVWADSIDGKREDLLKLIDEVSSRTVTGLNQKLGVQQVSRNAEARTTNPKAFEQYLRARALNGSVVRADHRAQIDALQRAIDFDPKFAAAYADMAIALSLGQARALDVGPDVAQRTEWYAREAVRLDPNLASAHLALSRAFVRFPDRFGESVRENLAAIRLNSKDAVALNSLATYFVSIGDSEKARCIGEQMMRVDPGSNEVKTRGYWYVNAVDPEGAISNARLALSSKDSEAVGHDITGIANVLLGNLPVARAEADKTSALLPRHYLGKSLGAMIAAAAGDRAAMEDALHTFEADANQNHWAAMRQALCYAKAGDNEKAIEWMRRSSQLGNHSWYAWVKHPWTQALQSDPEFQQIVSRMKLDLDDVHDDVIGVYQLICR